MSVARIREIARRCEAQGIRVAWEPGWERRGNGMASRYSGAVVHHTASGFANANLDILVYGRRDLSGPLCNVCTWADGTLGVIAAHPANHAGASGGRNTWPLPVTRSFNAHVIGNEIIYPGTEPMTRAQMHTALVFSAIAVEVCGWGDRKRIKAHAETSVTGKWDPGYAPGRTIDMTSFRDKARHILRGGGGAAPGRDDDVSKADALEALEEFFDRRRHASRVPGSEVKLSLADAILDTNNFTYNAPEETWKAHTTNVEDRKAGRRGPWAMDRLSWIDSYTAPLQGQIARLQATVDGMAIALEALSANSDVDAAAIERMVTNAVQQSIEISGTVHVTAREAIDAREQEETA